MGLVKGTGYGVVPDALRDNKKAWDLAYDNWHEFLNGLNGDVVMGEGDMGLIGRLAGFPRDYNAARQTVMETVMSGEVQMQDIAHTLDEVAKTYEEKDGEYYEKFGYLSDDEMSEDRLS
ncbi:MAG: hypothetical protein QOI21_3085 [Actinomycetota bacterium]|nr:hypothetical protein [Actinomycetota bacterium]